MTIELWILIASCGLALFMSSVPMFRAMRTEWGLKAMIGNREGLSPLTGWGGRLVRAHHNLMDNLLLFGFVVLTAHVIGISNEVTVLGAQVFLVCRLVHALVYTIGLSVVRTVAYLGGAIGTIMIVSQFFGAFL
ncbi:MAG: MAPEG family protein [Parvibaculaceae bacterium]|nr:MAPEG family protein [Parvibaculaceae bacterium]